MESQGKTWKWVFHWCCLLLESHGCVSRKRTGDRRPDDECQEESCQSRPSMATCCRLCPPSPAGLRNSAAVRCMAGRPHLQSSDQTIWISSPLASAPLGHSATAMLKATTSPPVRWQDAHLGRCPWWEPMELSEVWPHPALQHLFCRSRNRDLPRCCGEHKDLPLLSPSGFLHVPATQKKAAHSVKGRALAPWGAITATLPQSLSSWGTLWAAQPGPGAHTRAQLWGGLGRCTGVGGTALARTGCSPATRTDNS